jgi:predicted dehydrogenase
MKGLIKGDLASYASENSATARVDRHLPTIGPSLKAGKNVYVEWPLGKDSAEARELARLKNESGVKIATVGLQARQASIIKKLKELVDGGRVGKVLSSTYTAQSTQVGEGVIEGSEYLGFTESGGNWVTIRFGHQIDYVQQGICPTIIKNLYSMKLFF